MPHPAAHAAVGAAGGRALGAPSGAAWTGPLAAMPLERWQWLLQLNLTSGTAEFCAVGSDRDQAQAARFRPRHHKLDWSAHVIAQKRAAGRERVLKRTRRWMQRRFWWSRTTRTTRN